MIYFIQNLIFLFYLLLKSFFEFSFIINKIKEINNEKGTISD
jgi:hypothetical protein